MDDILNYNLRILEKIYLMKDVALNIIALEFPIKIIPPLIEKNRKPF